ncbi:MULTISPECIES: hypothetical protein [unclassified Nostoc]|uniref:hypothetical protein n=1 Tax=unclassified Nostoc TaxID=2593658 RepID=UPI000CF32422|nr:hypothetical protein [Nostoc sp. 'Peltigera membranacea cyanobiont' N6]
MKRPTDFLNRRQGCFTPPNLSIGFGLPVNLFFSSLGLGGATLAGGAACAAYYGDDGSPWCEDGAAIGVRWDDRSYSSKERSC